MILSDFLELTANLPDDTELQISIYDEKTNDFIIAVPRYLRTYGQCVSNTGKHIPAQIFLYDKKPEAVN